jgi:hypothetical protein
MYPVLDETLPLFQAVFHGHFDVADWLVAEGNAQKPAFLAKPDIYELDTTSDTYELEYPYDDATSIVHYAANKYNWHVLKWLFERCGVDPNCRANTDKGYHSYHHTPLTHAANSGNSACVRYLLTLPNIDVNKLVNGRSPLSYITKSREFLYPREELIDLAVKRGAVNIPTDNW